jgi:hypothetical protein
MNAERRPPETFDQLSAISGALADPPAARSSIACERDRIR